MSLTYPLAFPTVNNQTLVKSCNLKLAHSAAISESSTNYKQLVSSYNAVRWEAEITIRPLTNIEGMAFSAFIAGLQGVTKTFRFGNPLMDYSTARTAEVRTSDKEIGDNALGITINDNLGFTAGSHFEIGQRLYMMLEDLTIGSSTSHIHTGSISPPLRSDVSVGDNIIINQPQTNWRLATNDIGWDINESAKYDFTFNCVEAL